MPGLIMGDFSNEMITKGVGFYPVGLRRGDDVEYIGIIALALAASYIDLPSQIKKLKRELNRVKKYQANTRKEVLGR